jgi:glycerophosphoryl diester phosphodiesterase
MSEWPGPVPKIIGHRGAAAVAPENTGAGLRAGAAAGAVWIEVDARLTADGVPVLVHDATLDRTTDGTGPVRAVAAEALASLDAGAWFGPEFAGERIPTLTQALHLALTLRIGLNVELKADEDAAAETGIAVANTVASHTGPLLISSFEVPCLTAFRQEAPGIALALNAQELSGAVLDVARDLECVALHVAADAATPEALAQTHRAGLKAGVFTVNDPAMARRFLTGGAGYVFTDDPAALASF